MQTPPPVSGEAYPTEVGSEARSNYLYAGFTFNTAYSDNVLASAGTNSISDISYSIWPTISLDKTTLRLHETFTYSPGFTFYQHTSSLNEMDQNLALNFQYRLSPHMTASLQDSFRKSSNVLNQPYPLSAESISGSAQAPLAAVIAPIADQINNTASVEITYQSSGNSMIGASGIFSNLEYPEPNEVPGLSNSNYRGGAGFYNYRLSKTQYLGLTYQYSQTQGSLPTAQNGTQEETESESQTHAILLFYTIYLKPNLSLSLSGGPQHYEVSQPPFTAIRSWTPAATASMGWQGSHTSLAVAYSHLVGAGGGLLGAFDSNSANAFTRWQLMRTWAIGSAASYTINKNVDSFLLSSNPGGHMVSGSISVHHQISQHLNLDFGYTRIHQSYTSIAVISNAPDANRETISISYQFTRPLGR
jgi:hypothetical protein